jgi:hypothetical protein
MVSALIYFSIYTLTVQFVFGIAGILLYADMPASSGSHPASRFSVQFFSSLQLYAFSYLLYRFAQRAPQVPSKAFRLSILLMITVGVCEIFSIYAGGPSIPLTLWGRFSTVNQNLSSTFGSTRIHGLAGEPRFFAALLVILINALIFGVILNKLRTARLIRHRRIAIFLGVPTLLVLLFHTQSSSGLIMLFPTVIFTFFIYKKSALGSIKLTIYVALVSILFAPLLYDLIITRVIERVQEEVLSDQYFGSELAAYVEVPIIGMIALDATDATPMVLLLDNPLLAITGIGMGNISTYVKPFLPFYGGYWGYGFTGIVEPNLGILKSILNFGLFGNFLLIFFLFEATRHYRRYVDLYDVRMVFSFFLCVGGFVCNYLFSAPFISVFFFYSFHAGLVVSFMGGVNAEK